MAEIGIYYFYFSKILVFIQSTVRQPFLLILLGLCQATLPISRHLLHIIHYFTGWQWRLLMKGRLVVTGNVATGWAWL